MKQEGKRHDLMAGKKSQGERQAANTEGRRETTYQPTTELQAPPKNHPRRSRPRKGREGRSEDQSSTNPLAGRSTVPEQAGEKKRDLWSEGMPSFTEKNHKRPKSCQSHDEPPKEIQPAAQLRPLNSFAGEEVPNRQCGA
ncbi:predicted protein [Arabidopsis lyrata subsp. lyrata]|uniref:Predicted protein n=1 Tax=Arabidopsis lyrata subsp. lyrata TaxID=81972 RepID=D7KGQ8_ARALL|nr:predicted protein [Arabidopsis lyrata subsp. lyrata]